MTELFDEGAPAKAAAPPALTPRREPVAPLAPVIIDEGALRTPGVPLAAPEAAAASRPTSARYTALLERRDGSVIPVVHTIGTLTGRPTRESQRDFEAAARPRAAHPLPRARRAGGPCRSTRPSPAYER